ncbi:MAG: hypothetical protein M0Z31_01415 [Clostridia bacterium]|nr:hypothetical protein [Clostridia bacterium]
MDKPTTKQQQGPEKPYSSKANRTPQTFTDGIQTKEPHSVQEPPSEGVGIYYKEKKS